MQPKDTMPERRKYTRLRVPISVDYTIPGSDNIRHATTTDLSADGVRFEASDKELKESETIELKLNIPGAANPVHVRGTVVWKKKISLEDSAPYGFGIEFSDIEEDNKNTFLKFLCDLTYNASKELQYAETRK